MPRKRFVLAFSAKGIFKKDFGEKTMIKVYLDHNIYQELKKAENKALLDKVMAAKAYTVFCFSEAHLYDLNQDLTPAKFEDMQFIEGIAGANCYSFSDRTEFRYRTPREYYDSFDWSHTHDYDFILEGMDELFSQTLRQIPLSFAGLIKEGDIPPDMPTDMKKMLFEPTNFYDFMQAMLGFTESITVDQTNFKKLLQYLHKNSLLTGIYASAGIEGYDGEKITDLASFRESYARKFIKEGQTKTRYDLYLDMYHGLELFGFVKGKPRKQKLMNLINDARHSFFGTVCDIIVSKDADFLEKTRFMYTIEEVRTRIIPFNELNDLLDELESLSKYGLSSLLEEVFARDETKEILFQQESGVEKQVVARLRRKYFLYFDIVRYFDDEHGSYVSISSEKINYTTGTLIKQIDYIIRRLLEELGVDINEQGSYAPTESIQNKSVLRTWTLETAIISLILDGELYLNVYPTGYLQKRWEEDKKTQAPA